MERILEPEVMDTEVEAWEYDQMDFSAVNGAFAQRAVELGPLRASVLDAGTGTARIPVLMAQLRPQWRIVGVDLARSMLALAAQNIAQAQCEAQITLDFADAKYLPYADCCFDGVVSNSLIHHLPNPGQFLGELARVLKPEGFILVRDLLRPEDEATLERWVEGVGADYSPHQTQLFRDSLRAALSLSEIEALAQSLDIPGLRVYQSSEYHWTLERRGT
ncbi:MAG: methyltransferase domain-containing protein [Cyanobacteriota bacterium]|nr:methyltransferase domain-containing protein [Cyanobacteriota bacterium]